MRPAWALVVALVCCVAHPAVAAPGKQPAPAPGSAPGQPSPSAAPEAAGEPAKAGTVKERSKKGSFLAWLAQVTGLSATSSGLRGGKGNERGEVWVQSRAGGAPRQLTAEGGFSWPVFSADDRQVIALRGGEPWAIPADGGQPVQLAQPRVEIVSLVGSGRDGLVVLTADRIGILDVRSGEFSPFEPATQEDRDEIAMLRAPGHSYDQGRLTVAERNGVLVVTEGDKIREMAFKGTASWQPSASHDRSLITFIRTLVSLP
jgi:hypothetical protein